jgi:predicted nucleic acid-binding protein
MNIVDSSLWLEYLMGTETGDKAAMIIENPADLVVPTITLYEVYKKLLAEKDKEYALDVISYMQTGTVIELSADLSLSAAHLSQQHGMPMADSIIYATALHYSATVYSCDKHFKDIPDIRYFSKTL